MKNKFLLSIIFLIHGCATIVKSPQTVVTFQGDPSIHTQVITPYGSTTLRRGIGSLAVHNSKADIPIQVICDKEDPVNVILPTNFAVVPGLLGNLGLSILWIVPGVIGFIIDGSGDTAYVPQTPFNVSGYCQHENAKHLSLKHDFSDKKNL